MSQLKETYHATKVYEFGPSYNVAPTFDMPVVLQKGSERLIEGYRWGLVPGWSKGPNPKYSMINARSETLSEKPSYRDAYRKRRCVVPANGFYEWKKTPDGKKPYYIYQKDRELMSFAGLYENWERDGQKIDSFTIITTSPNNEMEGIHDRMPAILLNEELDHWLDPTNQDTQSLQDLLRPYPDGQIQYHPVSKEVNNPKNQGNELIQSI